MGIGYLTEKVFDWLFKKGLWAFAVWVVLSAPVALSKKVFSTDFSKFSSSEKVIIIALIATVLICFAVLLRYLKARIRFYNPKSFSRATYSDVRRVREYVRRAVLDDDNQKLKLAVSDARVDLPNIPRMFGFDEFCELIQCIDSLLENRDRRNPHITTDVRINIKEQDKILKGEVDKSLLNFEVKTQWVQKNNAY